MMESDPSVFDPENMRDILRDPIKYDWFSCQIYRAFQRANAADRAILTKAFPKHYAVWMAWYSAWPVGAR